MERYEKNVYEAEKGDTFEVAKGTSEGLTNEELSKVNDYSENYVNPPIPKGYKYVCGEWNNGFVIERCSDGSQFVWIPVGSLDSNGTLDGKRYGFYISRYNISRSLEGKPQSVKGVMPWDFISFYDAKEVAATFEDNESVESHLTFNAEYDSVLEWLIESKAKTRNEVTIYSVDWGNSWMAKNSPRKLLETGSREEWCANNIYDLAGNVCEWTQGCTQNLKSFVRGYHYGEGGYDHSVNQLRRKDPYLDEEHIGFRITLCIKDINTTKNDKKTTTDVNSEKTDKEVTIKNQNIEKEIRCHEEYGSYDEPKIPRGYKHICGEWNNGFVIERCSDGSQFVWIPVGNLNPNGTLDGENLEQFGLRNWKKLYGSLDDLEEYGYYEELNDELIEQIKSVRRCGGFYISRYNISRSLEGKPQSVKGVMPWNNITFDYAKHIASTFEDNKAVKSHLVFGAEYDSVIEWLIETNHDILLKSIKDNIFDNITDLGLGNCLIDSNGGEVLETGSREEWCINKIYDFVGNTLEWTQEQVRGGKKGYRGCRVYRGMYYDDVNTPVARLELNPTFKSRKCKYLGFRIALCIK